MLPALHLTDLFSFDSTKTAQNIFDHDFDWRTVPNENGCYAFLVRDTLEILYVGSACSQTQQHRGLRQRVINYLTPSRRVPPSTKMIQNLGRDGCLVFQFWLCEQESDARKYELDATIKHKPKLNVAGVQRRSVEEYRILRNKWARERSRRKAGTHHYDPEASKKCPKCGKTEQCAEFSRSKYKKMGVRSYCKKCDYIAYRQSPYTMKKATKG